MTSNKPLDARDVRDGDEIGFNNAKNQIQLIRKLADEFLKTNAMTMSENMDAFKEEDENDDANYVAGDKGVREALYDKQDLSTFVKIQKTPDVHSLIYDAIKPNALFEILANEEIMQIIDVFKPEAFKKGEVVIRQGDMGREFYVVESGKLSEQVESGVSKARVYARGGELSEQVESGVSKARVYARGDAFGEVALVFGSPSLATITAMTDVRVWILERNVYSSVISSIRREQYQEKQEFLRECVVGDRPFFNIFDSHQIEDLAIAAKVDNFEEGEVILREGEIVETFYIVRSGTVERFKTNRAGHEDKAGTIDGGKVFGTTALLKGVGSQYTYRASTRVKVFYLTRHDFEFIIGSVKDAFENNTVMPPVSRTTWRDASRRSIATSSSLYKCDLDDLTFYKVLGRGAFGHVVLVQSKKTKRLFALKAQAKYNICRKKLQDRILNEFVIATQVEHKNLLKIHCAMQDEKYVYFLLDLLPGECCSWVGLFLPYILLVVHKLSLNRLVTSIYSRWNAHGLLDGDPK
jgi:CRP-like cAMP-binding protein